MRRQVRQSPELRCPKGNRRSANESKGTGRIGKILGIQCIGVAMSIQPHAWAASYPAALGQHLLDVIVNAAGVRVSGPLEEDHANRVTTQPVAGSPSKRRSSSDPVSAVTPLLLPWARQQPAGQRNSCRSGAPYCRSPYM